MDRGYNGKILRVDLSERKVWTEEPDELTYRAYLGGAGLAVQYLLKELPKGVDPLSPDNVLVLACSVITGTSVPGASRFTAAAKSPLTGGYGEAEAGGWWGPELKKAGYDAIIIKGKASEPVYLWINDGEVEIRDASKVWGMITGDSQDAIKEEIGDDRARILQIGPGGENLVRYACIINELKHANGRTGMGAVMGSKNLKAIAVRGTDSVEVADRDGVREVQPVDYGGLHLTGERLWDNRRNELQRLFIRQRIGVHGAHLARNANHRHGRRLKVHIRGLVLDAKAKQLV